MKKKKLSCHNSSLLSLVFISLAGKRFLSDRKNDRIDGHGVFNLDIASSKRALSFQDNGEENREKNPEMLTLKETCGRNPSAEINVPRRQAGRRNVLYYSFWAKNKRAESAGWLARQVDQASIRRSADALG